MKRLVPRFALGMMVVVYPAFAYADDPAAAEALFKEALAKYKEGDFTGACPKFAESQALDPRPGTLFAMAECEAAADHIATAATLYEDFLRTVAGIKNPALQAKYLERMKKAQQRRDELIPEIPRLTLVLPPGSSPDVRITRNGETFTATSLGVELPVNPGEQVITVQVALGSMREQRITIGHKERQTVVLDMPVPSPPPPVEPWGPYAPPKPLPMQPPQTLRGVGFVVMGTGIAGLIAGAVSGGFFLRAQSLVEQNCSNHVCTTPDATAAGNNLFALTVTNALGLGIGGVAMIAGAIMIGASGRTTREKQRQTELQWEPFFGGSKNMVVGLKGAF